MRALAALLLMVSTSATASEPGRAREVGLHGACVMHLDGWEGRYDPEKAEALFRHLRTSGAQAVSLSAFAWQDSLSATELRPWDGDESGPADLRAALRQARAQGLTTFVKPHVEIGREGRRDPSAWRGGIRFDRAAEARAWFGSYRSFLVPLAALCEQEGVELFAVGLELVGLSSSWPDEWRELIGALREVYTGAMTYCANWWGEFGKTELWRELDLLGVQAFAPLSSDPRAGQAELRAGARGVIAAWRRESERWKKPLVLTEFGFKSSPAPWVEPWQWKGGASRPLAQRRAHAALLGELELQAKAARWLAGSFVWLYEASEPRPGPSDSGFSPGGKPAEELLEAWWRSRSGGPPEDP